MAFSNIVNIRIFLVLSEFISIFATRIPQYNGLVNTCLVT